MLELSSLAVLTLSLTCWPEFVILSPMPTECIVRVQIRAQFLTLFWLFASLLA